MTRRTCIRGLLGGGLAAVCGPAAPPTRTGPYSARAVDLVWESGAVDMLGLITADWPKLSRWRTDPSAITPDDFLRMAGSGVAAFHPAVHLPSKNPRNAVERWLGGWNRIAAAHPDRLSVVKTYEELSKTEAGRKMGLLLGSQNSTHFETTADVSRFAALGQRVSQLTYNSANRLGYGCGAGIDRGLTPFGTDVVAEMNRVGMLIDVSHAGPRTARDAVLASRSPVVISHTNCRALTPRENRCVSDALIRDVASRGGVIGLTLIRKFVGGESVERLLDHFQHVIRVAGPEHVGIGSDADLEGRQPVLRDLTHAEFVFAVADGLVRRGLSDEDVRNILGGNFRRVLASALPVS